MPIDSPTHLGTLEQWQSGVLNMRRLGSKFVAIYGAEPLTRPKYLAEVITAIYQSGQAATIITALPRSPLLKKLFAISPLDSLTVSWDGVYGDLDREKKSTDGQHILKEYAFVRDRSVVATVSALNVQRIPEMARVASAQGWWFLFDLYHPGAGPLSKCNDAGGLREADAEDVREMAEALLELKREGGRVHASELYLTFLAEHYKGRIRDVWHCVNRKAGWLTVNSDGCILPCDDWQKSYPLGKIWDELLPLDLECWKNEAVADCPGCLWNTHFDAVAIEENLIPLGSYVH